MKNDTFTALLFHICFNLPTKWQTLLRMKYVLCSVRKGNTNNMMEKKWLCEILHIAGLLKCENPIQIQTETFIKHVLLAKVRAINRQRPCKARAHPTQARISFWVKVLHNIKYYKIASCIICSDQINGAVPTLCRPCKQQHHNL